jgi:hypothetical protein
MATIEENITTVFKNVRKKQSFLETFQSGSIVIPGTDISMDLSAEDVQSLKDQAVALCDESITALNEIRTAAGGE